MEEIEIEFEVTPMMAAAAEARAAEDGVSVSDVGRAALEEYLTKN